MVKRSLQAGLVVLLLLTSSISVYAIYQLSQLQSAIARINQQIAPKSPYAMWSVGTGGDGVNPYIEWVSLYPQSTLYPIPGAPSLHFKDQAPVDADHVRDFEIGFYKYGPTWYTRDGIIEFWVGNGHGGIFSIAGNDNGGGEVQVRNPTDTDSIRLEFHDAAAPTIATESGIPLHFAATKGLISDDQQTFTKGIDIPASSGFAGQVLNGHWNQGTITVPTTAIKANSLVLVTPLSQPKGQWWVSHVDAQKSFTVSSSASDENMAFNWLIVGD